MTLANSRPTQPKIISARQDSVRQYANPVNMICNLWLHRELIRQFTKRQVVQHYKGSYLGILWSFITPLGILAVYTFAFSVILKARWQEVDGGSHAGFALTLFTGFIAFDVFSGALTSAPQLITNNVNYVKKVVFPLEILPVCQVNKVLIDSLFNLLILFLGILIFLGLPHWTVVFLPLIYLPLTFLSLGLSWFLASLGVFIRDIGPSLALILRMLFFLTPIIYPLSSVPKNLYFLIYLNPLAFIVNHFRRVIIFGQMPDWDEFLVLTIVTFIVCLFGYIWFMKSKKTFADVI